MREGWRLTTLGEITSFASGYSFPLRLQGKIAGRWPIYKVSDMNTPGNEHRLDSAANWLGEDDLRAMRGRVWPPGTVVFPKVGAALLTEKRRILTKEGTFDNNVMGLIPGPLVVPEFLLLLMEATPLGPIAQQGAVPSVNQGLVAAVPVVLPPLDEQRRIIDVAKSFDSLWAASASETSAVTSLINAVCRDHLARVEGKVLAYDQIITMIGGVWGDAAGVNEVDVLALGPRAFALNARHLDSEGSPTRSVTSRQYEQRQIREGDVILERSGGTEGQPVGRVIFADKDAPSCIPTDFMRLLHPDPRSIEPRYLFWRLWWDWTDGISATFQRRTTGIFNLPVKDYLARQLIVPTRNEQKVFADTLDALESVRTSCINQQRAVETARQRVLSSLLEGGHEIPESYDSLYLSVV